MPAAKVVPTSFAKERYIRIGSSKENIRKFPEKEAYLFDVLRHGYPTVENIPSEYQDLTFENGKLLTHPDKIAKSDKSSGIRSCKDKELAAKLIKNTYKTLLSRGQKGCFVYCEDASLRDYLRNQRKKF